MKIFCKFIELSDDMYISI